MNKTQSQRARVMKVLNEQGKISRNFTINNRDLYGIRIGAIICYLNKNGWVIEGKDDTDRNDYVYTVVTSPFRKVVRTISSIGKTITSYERIK